MSTPGPTSKQHNAGSPARARILIPPVADAEAALVAHLETCPGTYFECYGKPRKERMRQRWLARKDVLEGQLRLAQEAQHSGWRNAKGERVDPLPWRPESKAPAKDRAAENRAAYERRKAGETKANGRPRSENPSARTLMKRAQREKAKAAA